MALWAEERSPSTMLLFRQKFRGCLLGALSGNCLGSAYDSDDPLTPGETVILQKRFDQLEEPDFKAPVLQFTDDLAMTRSLAQSLIDKKHLDLLDLAKKFVKSYYQEPNRWYGSASVNVFQKLRGNKFTDLMGPATEQFNGHGSLGNGAAMRVSPLPLFCYDTYERLDNLTRKQSLLTHTHEYGINGAILQAKAIERALSMTPGDKLDPDYFLYQLIIDMDRIGDDEEEFLDLDEAVLKPYKTQLILMKDMFEEDLHKLNVEQVVQNLGNLKFAYLSVPTAIFCFLYAQNPIEGINTDDPVRRAIQYAITLGGDAETIASMAGAIAGAYYGDEKINSNMLKHCECSEEFAELGDKLFDIMHKE